MHPFGQRSERLILSLAVFLTSIATSPSASTAAEESKIFPAVSFELQSGDTKSVRWHNSVTESDLQNPGGYFPPSPPTHRLQERIEITNSGTTRIHNPKLDINGRSFLTVNDPLAALGLDPHSISLEILFTTWKERRVHATSGLPDNTRAIEVLRAFGVTLCKEDSMSLADIVMAAGGSSRPVRVNGHIVYEFSLNGKTAVLDGDQNTIYPRLDGKTLADESDLRADPLLAIRARVFGKQMPFRLPGSWMNASRFEHHVSEPKTPLKKLKPWHHVDWEMYPGEKLVFFPSAESLPAIYAKTPEHARNPILRESVIAVAFHLDIPTRKEQDAEIALPFPAVAWVYSGGRVEPIIQPGDTLVYSVPLPMNPEEGMILLCQAAKGMLPAFDDRENRVHFSSDSRAGKLQITCHANTSTLKLQPVLPPWVKTNASMIFGVPGFDISSDHADAMWWQVSDNEAFDPVLPNFDTLQDGSKVVQIATPIETTFFLPDQDYFFRAKHRVNGIWSPWSSPCRFRVEKPDAPTAISVISADADHADIRWEPTENEIWIFGSNRMDFLPDIFSTIEPTKLENNALVEFQPSQNLLGKFDGKSGHTKVPARAFYRIIAQREGIFSLPSPLFRLSGHPLKTVLQNTHTPPASDVATPVSLP